MAIGQAILVAVFMMAVVFIMLIALWGCIRLFNEAVRLIEKKPDDSGRV